MTRLFGREGLTICALVVVIAAAGCTNSEVITSGGAAVELDGVASPPVGSDYALATIRVSQVHVRPTDPTANMVLGLIDPNDPTKGIGLIQFPGTVDMKSSAAILLGQVVLGPGQYRGTQFSIQRVDLNTAPSVPASTECSGGVLTSVRTDPQLSVHLSASDLFVVPVEGQIVIALRADGNKFVQLLQSHCAAQGNCSGQACTFPSADEFEAAGVFSLGE